MGPTFFFHHGVEIVKIRPPQTDTFGYLTSQVIAEIFVSPEVSYLKKTMKSLSSESPQHLSCPNSPEHATKTTQIHMDVDMRSRDHKEQTQVLNP